MKSKNTVLAPLITLEVIIVVILLVVGVIFSGMNLKSLSSASEEATVDATTEASSENEVDMTSVGNEDIEATNEITEEEVIEEEVSRNYSFDDTTVSQVAAMTLDNKIGQLIVTTPDLLANTIYVDAAGSTTKSALSEVPAGALIYMEDNYNDDDQLNRMLNNTADIYTSLGLPQPILFWGSGETISDRLFTFSYVGVSEDTYSSPFAIVLSTDEIEMLIASGYDGLIIAQDIGAYDAISAGADMTYSSGNAPTSVKSELYDAVVNGEIPEEVLDAAVCRILTYKSGQ